MPLPSFTNKTDLVDIIYAADVNNLQNEVAPTAAASAHVRYSTSYTSTTSVTLTDASMPVQSINFTASGSFILPAVSTANHPFYLVNRSTSITSSVTFSGSTLISLPPGVMSVAYPDSTASWRVVASSPYAIGSDAPEGQLINGKLSPTVASNNLTLAIKTIAGNDPSSTDPVGVKINGTVRWITAALSVTLNAGTQYFALGTAFATLEQDFFAYVSWRAASSAVVLGFARFPYAAVYSEFSATNTNEKYGAFSTAPASTDDVVVCGRFAATLSASASFNWSVPTYTSINLVQRPIYDSRIQSYVPVWASSGTQPVISDGTIVGMYQFRNRKIFLVVRIVMGASTTYGTGTYNISIPFAAAAATNATNPGSFSLFDSSAATMYIGAINLANAGTTGNLFTHGATQTSATVPITLAQSDVISVFNDYAIVVP